MLAWSIVACVVLAFVHASEAATYYVATTGSDANSCTTAQTIGTPKQTIDNAIGCLAAGDTLYIRAGTYVEMVQVGTGLIGIQANPVVIAGYPGDARPVIRPSSSAPTNQQIFIIHFVNGRPDRYLTLRDFEIDGSNIAVDSGGGNTACLYIGSPRVTVDNLIFRNCPRDGIQAFSRHHTIRNSQILSCGRIQPPTGPDVQGVKGVGIYFSLDDDPAVGGIGGEGLFENNIVDGCRAGGPTVHYDGVNNVTIRNNIVRNFGGQSTWGIPQGTTNGAAGITVGGAGVFGSQGPQNANVYNNIIYNGRGLDVDGFGGVCIWLWGTRSDTIANNTCYNMEIGYFSNCGTTNATMTIQNNIKSAVDTDTQFCGSVTGTISHSLVNPTVSTTFVDAATADFHLKSGAPAVDAGATVTVVTMDYDNVQRPQSAAYDIGAYELADRRLIGHWKLDETSGSQAADSSGVSPANHGTLQNFSTPNWIAGKISNALQFDPTAPADYVNIADAAVLDLTGAFTIAGWVKPAAALSGFVAMLVKNYVYFLYASATGEAGDCAANQVEGGFVSLGTGKSVCHATPLTANVWTHLAVSYNLSTLKLYKNGAEVASAAATGAVDTSTGAVQLAQSQFNEPLNGSLDDMRLYNYALSATEVQALYDLGASQTYTVTLSHSRCEFPHLSEAATRVYAAEDASCLRVAPTGVIGVRQQLRCSNAACPAQVYVPYASLNGGTAAEITANFGTHKLRFTADQAKTNLENTTRQLTSCTFVAGKVYENQVSYPSVTMANGECTEFVYIVELQNTVVEGDTLTVGTQTSTGSGVVQTQPLTIPVFRGGGFN